MSCSRLRLEATYMNSNAERTPFSLRICVPIASARSIITLSVVPLRSAFVNSSSVKPCTWMPHPACLTRDDQKYFHKTRWSAPHTTREWKITPTHLVSEEGRNRSNQPKPQTSPGRSCST